MKTRRMLSVALALLAVAIPATAAGLKAKDIEAERNLGKEGAAEAAKSMKFVSDPKYIKRVEAIGLKIVPIAKTYEVKASYGSPTLTDFTYSFKVVDDKTANAFSLPGGYIYVNKGLIDRIESDDELAGVIAHEISHVSHHHMLQLLRKQSQIDSSILLIIAAATLGKASSGDMANVFYGAKLVEMAKLNSWSQKAEYDADNTAIEYMIKTGYKPVGMVTVLEGLAREETYNPAINNMGAAQDHPLSGDRARNIITNLTKRGISIDRWQVESGTVATVRDVVVKDHKLSEVVAAGKVIFQPTDNPTASSKDRAKKIADALNKMLRQDPGQWEVRISPDGTAVYLRQELIVEVAQSDADIAGTTKESLANKAKDSIQAAILSEQMRRMY